MKPLFTIHEGEFLVGSHIEKKFRDWNVWIPSKDKGIDFLVSNSNNSKTVSIQVKFSRDYSMGNRNPIFRKQIVSGGWWVLNLNKLYDSTADFWVMVMHSYSRKGIQYVIISPNELYRRLVSIHRQTNTNPDIIHTYLTVTKLETCWENRGLNQQQIAMILSNQIEEIDEDRNFSQYLNNWEPLKEKLG